MAKRINVECKGHYDTNATATIKAEVLPTGYAFISERQYRDAVNRAGLVSGDYLVFSPLSDDTWSTTDDGWMTVI